LRSACVAGISSQRCIDPFLVVNCGRGEGLVQVLLLLVHAIEMCARCDKGDLTSRLKTVWSVSTAADFQGSLQHVIGGAFGSSPRAWRSHCILVASNDKSAATASFFRSLTLLCPLSCAGSPIGNGEINTHAPDV